MHAGIGPGLTPRPLGNSPIGEEAVSLNESQIPKHTHIIKTGLDAPDSNTRYK